MFRTASLGLATVLLLWGAAQAQSQMSPASAQTPAANSDLRPGGAAGPRTVQSFLTYAFADVLGGLGLSTDDATSRTLTASTDQP